MTAAELRLRRARRIVDRRRPALWPELIIVTAIYLVFTRIQGNLGQDPVAATRHALAVQHLERVLHVGVEHLANAWAAGIPLVAASSAIFYTIVLAIPPLVLLGLYLWRPDVYASHRRSLTGLSFLSLPAFWLYPVSPPRLAQRGIVDLVSAHSPLAQATSPASASHANLYAATPSLHVAWSLWCAVAVSAMVRGQDRWRKVKRVAPYLFPLLVAIDVVVTGNHYVLDVALGVALTLAAVAIDGFAVRRSESLVAAGATRVTDGAPSRSTGGPREHGELVAAGAPQRPAPEDADGEPVHAHGASGDPSARRRGADGEPPEQR